jgi:hypothetical protein
MKALRLLFLLSLTLGLFGGEIGESICLVDDTANDFVQASVSSIHKCSETAPGHLISPRRIVLAEELVQPLPVISSTQSAPSSGSDLLCLISIQRK